MNLLEWLDYELLDNSLLTWGAGVGLFLVAWVVLGVARRLIRGRLHALAERRQAAALQIAAHVVGQTKGWFLLLMALSAGASLLDLPEDAETFLSRVVVIGLLLQLGLWATVALTRYLTFKRERQLAADPGTVAAMDVLGFVLHAAVWTIVVLVALDNLGVDITAMVAGLGIGGIAVALAAQNVLGDLFASLSIVLDKPFVVGDFLDVDDYLGSVEHVGLKTTRLRSLSGEQLVFSNNDLLNSRIRNYGRMFERRVVFSLGVTYETSPEKLRAIPAIIREAVEARDKVRFDRAHFKKYGDFALVFEVVYYVLSADYTLCMDIQQSVNLRIYERFAEEGIEFAYPTQQLYLTETAKA